MRGFGSGSIGGNLIGSSLSRNGFSRSQPLLFSLGNYRRSDISGVKSISNRFVNLIIHVWGS
jgi:hypothetical protein